MTPLSWARAAAIALFAGPFGPVLFVGLHWRSGQLDGPQAALLGPFVMLSCALVTWNVWNRVPSGVRSGALMGLNVGVAVTGMVYAVFVLTAGAMGVLRNGLMGLLVSSATIFVWGILLLFALVFLPPAWAIVFPPVLWCGLLGAMLGAWHSWLSGTPEAGAEEPVTRDSVPPDASP